jgi:ribosomal protein S18 acetylase RimI-like enzyme
MISIRRAIADDADLLSDIYRHFGDRKPSYFKECIEQGYAIFIASIKDQNVGFGTLNFSSRYAPFARLNIPEIQDLNVIPDQRQQGIASALINACEDEARKRGCADIGLGVGLNKSYGPAQRLYVKMGYSPDGSGAMYDHKAPDENLRYPLDDDFCLMLVKAL